MNIPFFAPPEEQFRVSCASYPFNNIIIIVRIDGRRLIFPTNTCQS